MKILNFGSLNIDYVYEVDHMVQPGKHFAQKAGRCFAAARV